MNIYKISIPRNLVGYDEYDAIVTYAKNEDSAINIATGYLHTATAYYEVELVGKAPRTVKNETVILSSFNAG